MNLKDLNTIPNTTFIIDEVVWNEYREVIQSEIGPITPFIVKGGEECKSIYVVDYIIQHLIKIGADRNTTLIGIGGGSVTDLTGFVASIYMRGIRFGFVPTTLLGLVDASIGGKNGINIGLYKNVIGCITQPEFIVRDLRFLNSLSDMEWKNGFAEIIKHAVISNKELFVFLEKYSIDEFINMPEHNSLLEQLIEWNVGIKNNIVSEDVYELNRRKILNFGHTLGHAIENLYGIKHGFAVAIGMVYSLSVKPNPNANRIISLLEKYGLPVGMWFDTNLVAELIYADKKKSGDSISFIYIKDIGEADIVNIHLSEFIKSLNLFTKKYEINNKELS